MGWGTNKKAASPLGRDRALECTPVKNVHVRETRLESGEVVLHYPVAASPWVARLSRLLSGGGTRASVGKLQLDSLGTAVWDLLDGKRPLRGIVSSFAAAHQLERREAELAVTRFVRELGRRGLVGLR
jgi:hypothetical protein